MLHSVDIPSPAWLRGCDARGVAGVFAERSISLVPAKRGEYPEAPLSSETLESRAAEVSTVSQRHFHLEWLTSIGRTSTP